VPDSRECLDLQGVKVRVKNESGCDESETIKRVTAREEFAETRKDRMTAALPLFENLPLISLSLFQCLRYLHYLSL